MADIEVTVSRIVVEDLDLGTGTVDVPTSDGGTRTGNKINASHLPLKPDGSGAVVQADNVDGAIAELKGEVDTKAVASDTYTKTEVDGLLAEKSDVGHGHTIPDVIGLQAALDGKSNVGHGHAIGDVSGLQDALDGKSSTAHNHDSAYAPMGHVGSSGNAHGTATTTTAGFMSSGDKSKLDGIQAGAINQTTADGRYEQLANKGVANGYASLGADGKIPSSQIPAIAITDTFVVNTEADMLALVAEIGDVAVRTDIDQTFILKAEPVSVLANWELLRSPTDAVDSVNGQTGVVVLTHTDVGAAPSSHDHASISGNAATASKLQTARTISLTGDATGSASFDGSADASITVTVQDDSHNHVISNVDGLQAALDSKSNVGHVHDDLYYTETEVDAKLGDKADLAGSIAQDFSARYFIARSVSVNSLPLMDPITHEFEYGAGYPPVLARTGPATYLSPDGLKTAQDGVARIGFPGPVVRRNLINWSGNLGQWSKSGGATVTYSGEDSVATDPDTGNFSQLTSSMATVSSSDTATAALIVKKTSGALTWPSFSIYFSSGGTAIAHQIMLNTDTGATSTVQGSPSGIAVTTWDKDPAYWELKFTGANNSTGNTAAAILIAPARTSGPWPGSASASVTGSVAIRRAQLNLGATALPYQPTNATGVDLTHPLNGAGLVLEGAGENLVPNTNGRPNTMNAGGATPPTVELVDEATPFGSQCWKITFPAGTPEDPLNDGYNGCRVLSDLWAFTSNTVYTFTVWIKGMPASHPITVYHTGTGAMPGMQRTGARIGDWEEFSSTGSNVLEGMDRLCLYGGGNVDEYKGISIYVAASQVEVGPLSTSLMLGPTAPVKRFADRVSIVPPHNELAHSHDLTASAWAKTSGASVTKLGTANTLTLAATTDSITQAVTPPDVPGTTRTVAVRLRLGTLSGSVRLRLLDQSGNQIASTTINTADLHATDARTFYVTGTPSGSVTGLQVQIIGQSGTGTVIVESLRLVRGWHPGVDVETTDTPIYAPPSPALDPTFSQNGAFEVVILPPPASTGAAYNLLGYGQGGSAFSIWRTSSGTGSAIVFERAHNGPTGTGGTAGRAYIAPISTPLYDGAPHDVILEWTNEVNEATGVREMWQRIWIDGVLVAQQDVAALYGATAWATIDPTRLISGGAVYAVISGLEIQYPIPKPGYILVN